MKNYKFIKVLIFLCFFNPGSVVLALDLSDAQRQLLDTLPPDQQRGVMSKMLQADQLNQDLQNTFEEFDTVTERSEKKELSSEDLKRYKEKSKNWVYGYEIFQSSPTTFAPATDIPISGDYILGPGDEIKVQIFGNRNFQSNSSITRSGEITLPEIGPVSLVGLNLNQATELINKKVSSKLIGTEAYITLGKLRTITVYVLGEAYQPGSYKVSSFTTLTNLLFVSGGVSEIGSIRNIQVKRDGRTISSFDLYDVLLQGDTSKDVLLRQGDTIFIPLIEGRAAVYGSFRRPHLFELKEGDTLGDLISFAGGLKNQVRIEGKLELTRITKDAIKVKQLDLKDTGWLSTVVRDGDMLSAQADSSLTQGIVELTGEVKYPGFYQIKRKEKLSSVIKRAGGYSESAYPYGAVFTRTTVASQQRLSYERSADYLEQSIADAVTGGGIENLSVQSFEPISTLITRLRQLEPTGRQVIVADQLKIKADPALDFSLQDGDTLHIPIRPNEITVVGEVINPSSLTFRPGKSVSDYIQNAGGFKKTADTKNVFIILPNGESQSYNDRKFWGDEIYAIPGTTIVIPRSSLNWLVWTKTITPILGDSFTALATVIALLDR
jgi:polysaccharide export outer membrane protein